MRRREFITLVGGAVTWPLSARAQQSTKLYRIGILSPGLPEPQGVTAISPNVRMLGWIEFSARLRELGWNEGENMFLSIVTLTTWSATKPSNRTSTAQSRYHCCRRDARSARRLTGYDHDPDCSPSHG